MTIAAISAALGRPEPGAQFRFRNKLADWATRPGVPPLPVPVDASEAASDCRQPAVATADALHAQHLEAAPAAAPALAPLAPGCLDPALVPVLDHLATLRADSMWKAGDDQELMRLTDLRWPVGDVAAEIGLSVDACKARHRLLTNAGRFLAAKVLDALRLKQGEA